MQVQRASVISRRSNKVSDVNIVDDEFENLSKLSRRGAVHISRTDLEPLINAVCQLDGGHQQVAEFLKRLIPIYTDMERHMRLAKDSKYVVDVLLEHAVAAILLKDTLKCKEILQTVEELLQSIDDKDFTFDVFRLSKISRIRGKVAYYSGDLEAAQRWFRRAGELLGIHQPSTNLMIWLSTIRCMVHLKTLRKFTVERSSREIPLSVIAFAQHATDKTLEQGYCLSDLLWFYRESGKENLVHLSILQQMIKVTGRTCYLHQVVESYAAAIKVCKIESTKRKLETQLFESCVSRHDELSHNDLVMLANMYTDMAINYLNAGDLCEALSSSTGAYEIFDKLNHQDSGLAVSPVLASCLFLTRRNDQFCEFLQRLQSPVCRSDGRIQRVWYYTFCVEGILNGDYPLQSFQCCLDFATHYLRSCDAVSYENVARLYLAMNIAVWFCRKGQWDSAQIWLDYSEVLNTNIVSFLSLYALSRKLEAMLLYLNTSKLTKSQKALNALNGKIEMDLKKLDKGCRKIPSMLPRFHHLKAYLSILKQSYFKTKWHLMTAVKIATKHGNILELTWVKRHRWMWFKRMDTPDQWPDSTSQGNSKSCIKESPIYNWPIIPQTNNKEQPSLQYSKTTFSQK